MRRRTASTVGMVRTARTGPRRTARTAGLALSCAAVLATAWAAPPDQARAGNPPRHVGCAFPEKREPFRYAVEGLPAGIDAGSGWHTFSLLVHNGTRTEGGTFRWRLGFEETTLSPVKPYRRVTVQYLDGQGRWRPHSETSKPPTGAFDGRESAEIRLRVAAAENAPAGTARLSLYVDHTVPADTDSGFCEETGRWEDRHLRVSPASAWRLTSGQAAALGGGFLAGIAAVAGVAVRRSRRTGP
ncbi:hypothetical protein [Streptomyces fradiae]|uniref:hypothetical protein n=1 Tax=Streptomyces fradiae TaxID=1906 RepID=UPI0036A68533